MSEPDSERVRKATAAAINALRPHFEKLVNYGVNRDHVWWDLMEALDRRKGRKPRPSWDAKNAARQRAKHAREGKAKKHRYKERNDQMRMQFERSRELGEEPARICERLAKLYKRTPRRIRMICRFVT